MKVVEILESDFDDESSPDYNIPWDKLKKSQSLMYMFRKLYNIYDHPYTDDQFHDTKAKLMKYKKLWATDPHCAMRLARYVIKGRFPEGEPAIASQSDTAYEYARYVIGERWPPGEKAVTRSEVYTRNYELAFKCTL